MQFANGSQLKGGSGFRPRQRRRYVQAAVSSMQNNNSLAFHSHDPGNVQPSNEWIEKISNADISSITLGTTWSDLEDNEKTANKLPAEIATGETGWRFFFAYGGMPTGSPAITGTFVIRHTLPGTYTISATGMTLGTTTTVDVNGTSMTRIEVTNILQQNCWIDVTGPVGAFPSDWDIQFLRVSDEAAYDNDSLPIWHATRYFIPEYLSHYVARKPHHKRFMKALRTELSLYNTLAAFPKATDRVTPVTYPFEMCVGFCNYVDCGGWFNFPMAAQDDLIDAWADFTIANLNSDLPAIFGHGNEHWNSGYGSLVYYMYEGMKQFGTQGPGKITFDGLTITNDGSVDFTTLFALGQTTRIAVEHPDYDGGGIAWAVKPITITATTMNVSDGTGNRWRTPLPGPANWYHVSPSSSDMNGEGYMYRSTLAMKRLTDKFDAAGQRGRLVRMYEAQLASPGTKDPLFNGTTIWTGPGSYDPLDYHDGIAINPYFGDGFLIPVGLNSGNAFKEAVRVAAEEDPPDQATYNSLMRDYTLGNTISGITPINEDMWWVKKRIMKWEQDCASKGLGLWGYEGGHHVIHPGATNADDKPIFDLYRAWLTSSEAQEVYEAWRDIQIPYLSGPIMKFQMFGATNRYGAYGAYLDYGTDESNNKEIAVLDTIRAMPAFWLPENPPVAVAVEDQNWTAGVQPVARHDANENFSLFHYVSVNATGFGVTSGPPGMAVNSTTGEVTGSPVAGSGSYVFTASNASGTVNIPINITVT